VDVPPSFFVKENKEDRKQPIKKGSGFVRFSLGVARKARMGEGCLPFRQHSKENRGIRGEEVKIELGDTARLNKKRGKGFSNRAYGKDR